MGRFISISALLLGIIGAVSGQGMSDGKGRPLYPRDPQEGCTPGGKLTSACPTRMECFADTNYPNGGRCDCNPMWSRIQKKLPFDDLEFDDGFTTSDCDEVRFHTFLASIYHIGSWMLSFAFIYTDFVVIRELVRNKALKWNATGTSLVLLLIQAIGHLCLITIYTFGMWGLDKQETWYERRSILFIYVIFPISVIVDFEIGITWIDLYDRTNKMSKNTSKSVKALRIGLRFFGLLLSIGFLMFTSMMGGGLINIFIGGAAPPIIGIIFVSIGGHLITKTLCPDRKDVANPNWKVAEAIRRGVKHGCASKFLELVGFAGLGSTSRHPMIGYAYPLFTGLYWFVYIFRMWGWLQYLIYGSRKHLKKFESEASSSYFGFSTIGLNKTLTSASSTMSSVVSSRSSAAPSTVE